MKIVTGATASNGQFISVELEESDLDTDISDKSLAERHKLMMKYGDILVVKYFKDADLFTEDYANKRLKEIASR